MRTSAAREMIRQRIQQATEGPWAVWDGCSWRRIGRDDGSQGTVIEPTVDHDGHPNLLARREDLEFIAHAREDVPALLMEVDRLQGLLDRAEAIESALRVLVGYLRRDERWPVKSEHMAYLADAESALRATIPPSEASKP